MRLNKYIAHAGIASRRKADELTINGNVKINGLTMREPGYNVKPGDVVEVNGQRISGQEKMEYVLLNKPKGYITSMQDEKGRPVVTELVADVDARLFPVGRLDYNTSGMLILTNDGDLTYRLTHPRHQVTKTYRALVSGVLSDDPLFVIINSYTTGLAPSVLGYMLHLLVAEKYGGRVTWDELGLPVTETGLALPCGATGRWCSE